MYMYKYVTSFFINYMQLPEFVKISYLNSGTYNFYSVTRIFIVTWRGVCEL
jgi:hypothetical protein